MKRIVITCIFYCTILSGVYAQQSTRIITFDFVKLKDPAHTKEVISFFENYWKVYRESALQQNYISSYQLITTKPTATVDFEIILITEYPDSTAYRLREQHFGKIMKETRPADAGKTGKINPRELFEIKFQTSGEVLFSSHK